MARGTAWKLFGAFAVAGAAAATWFVLRPPPGSRDPLDAIPAGTFAVATADVGALRTSPLSREWLTQLTRLSPDLADVEPACGLSVADRVESVVLAVPDSGPPGDFGAAVAMNIGLQELFACQRALGKRSARAPLATRSRGSFTLLGLQSGGGELPSAPPGPLFALRRGGPFLLGQGSWLERMMDASEGKAPRATTHEDHAALLAERNRPPPGMVAAAAASMLLSSTVRDRMRADLDEPVRVATDDSTAVLDAILSVRAAGMVAFVRADGPTPPADGKDVELQLVTRTDRPASTARLVAFAEEQRRRWAADLRARLLGAGPWLDGLSFETHDAGARVRLRLRSKDLEDLGKKTAWLDALRNLARGAANPP